MDEIKYPKLRGRIIEKYGSQTKFAAAIGKCRQDLSRKLCGKGGFTYKDIEIWSALLEIDKSEIGKYFFCS